ncbi:MAG: methionine--tRNA ligase [Actinobacteria bacterium]|nr:methionine--tRNA ligase [Actinomycetota bacterium]MCI0544725.1 methionine--tRNA ligase [Actinomycetota bacterium]
MNRHILVAVAWPYASGPLHLGHLGGAYLPADIFARYHRLAGDQVLMVSGSDANGTPITVKAEQLGVAPKEVVEKYHPEIIGYWESLGITFDLFTTTMTQNHHQVTQDFFLRLLEKGFLEKGKSEQFYDPEAERFLPDRYVEGTCPHCGYTAARGDQCDNCGRTLDPTDLIQPRSRLTGATPERRETEHYFLKLPLFADRLRAWIEPQTRWRRHVRNWALGMLEDIPARAITRDIEWGVELPVDDLGPGKRIYVWFDAVIGYLSAAIEWAKTTDDPEAWRQWWEDPEAESYYFIGKDNIPFHTVIWPAMLMGYGGLNLPTDVPANQYITFKGEKASKSKGVGQSIGWYAERLQPDALRYAIASVLPEQQDTDLSDDEIIRRVNEELVATWGNLVNRVLTMSDQHFGGRVPEPGELEPGDEKIVALAETTLDEVAKNIESVELRAGLRSAMEAAAEVNAYLNATEPWRVVKVDPERAGTILWAAIQAIAGIRVALAPYLPRSAITVGEMLGLGGELKGWATSGVAGGTPLGEIAPLYVKLDEDYLS